MHFSQAVLLAGAIGAVSAVSASHAHLHRDVQARASSSSSTGFCGASRKHKRATDAEINYAGNLGTNNGCLWGSNWINITESDLVNFNYTVTVKNNATETIQCICANKIGVDGKLDGFFDDGSQSPLTFSVSSGSSAFVAVEPNTQGMVMCNPNTVPTSPDGQWLGIWLEIDMADKETGGWSGADISALAAQTCSQTYPKCSQTPLPGGYVDTATGPSSPSWICPGGTSSYNAYVSGFENVDGIGLKLSPGPAALVYTVGALSVCPAI